ncbi:MAG: response regulator transcription factor [Ignavibacteriaceae bacterium]|nr:response regulator transcription factor [Ignavibacteriaceae bacterium]HMN24287.1 response regulator transcription factor [Ignavibacteriaceae bacterium]HRN27923.1 response regulator transcription factor [Ignavibacteriaceae bacterium]HRP94224.1 response regulator transcription factor [Ignavibacteriaceae bacterium]HRQ54015.1 response regulator transcription factor [Ignavibacteriaceae bacterium]
MSDGQLEKSKILLVEDEENLAHGLEYNLTEEGYKVTRAKDGREAIKFFDENIFDLIVLDIMLPYFNGFEIAKHVREKQPQMPILMLTARTQVEDRVKGLEIGADDYLTKPFHLKELLLRIKGMLKRKKWYQKVVSDNPVYKFGNNEINFENFKCKKDKNTFQLTSYEAMIMKYLIDNKDKVVSRKELLENVWNMNPDVETRTVDNFIVRLRKYFEDDPSNPKYIVSVRSAGYIFQEV